MRKELEKLQKALDSGKKGKGKKGKKGKKGMQAKQFCVGFPPQSCILGKKDKKGKKGKKDKDPTSNRSIEDLWEELVKMEIIIPTKDIHLKDFIGDYSFLGGFSSCILISHRSD